MRRLPARESRWRDWLPEEASSGAVPFQEANRSRLANRWMSPTSASSRAAPEGPMPGELLIDRLELADQLDSEPAPGLPGQVPAV
jgi:hypothetical protein